MRKSERKAKQILINGVRLFSPRVAPVEQFSGDLDRVLIYAQEKMGDAILLTSLLALIQHNAPGVVIDVASMSPVKSPVFSFFEHDSLVRHVYHVKENYFQFIRQARQQRYDVIINTKDHPSFNFLLLTTLIPARYKVGIAHESHHGFFHWMADFDFHAHMVNKYSAILDFFGAENSQPMRPYIPDGPVSSQIQLWTQHMDELFLLGINLSAGHHRREWPLEAWRKMLSRIQDPTIIFSMPGRKHDKIQLEKEFDHVISTPATKSIFDVAALMKHVGLLVTPDTSLIHVASCVETPVVGLYTSETVHQKRFSPYGIPFKSVVSLTRNIADIPVQPVVQAVRKMKSALDVRRSPF